MAKTIIKGSYYSTTTVTLYTVPSDKYAKVTILYYGTEFNELSSSYNKVTLYINSSNQSGAGKFQVLDGHFPFVGQSSATSHTQISRGLIGSEGTFLMPPLTYLQADSHYNKWSSIYFIVEEIAKTTIEA